MFYIAYYRKNINEIKKKNPKKPNAMIIWETF